MSTETIEPSYLNDVLEEARETQELEPGWSNRKVAESVAMDQNHLISNLTEKPDNLEVLQSLREKGFLSARDLGDLRTLAPSYDHAEGTIEALVIASLEKFIEKNL